MKNYKKKHLKRCLAGHILDFEKCLIAKAEELGVYVIIQNEAYMPKIAVGAETPKTPENLRYINAEILFINRDFLGSTPGYRHIRTTTLTDRKFFRFTQTVVLKICGVFNELQCKPQSTEIFQFHLEPFQTSNNNASTSETISPSSNPATITKLGYPDNQFFTYTPLKGPCIFETNYVEDCDLVLCFVIPPIENAGNVSETRHVPLMLFPLNFLAPETSISKKPQLELSPLMLLGELSTSHPSLIEPQFDPSEPSRLTPAIPEIIVKPFNDQSGENMVGRKLGIVTRYEYESNSFWWHLVDIDGIRTMIRMNALPIENIPMLDPIGYSNAFEMAKLTGVSLAPVNVTLYYFIKTVTSLLVAGWANHAYKLFVIGAEIKAFKEIHPEFKVGK
ncbi:hypothetical protein G9A89_014329 [Geosiphon pyriformis]|nr:hypothetical protein G9A89_014329 [Geosiphon pyriformis]